MGYQPEEDADGDPFSSNSEDSGPSEDEESSDKSHDTISDDDSLSLCGPDYELLSD